MTTAAALPRDDDPPSFRDQVAAEVRAQLARRSMSGRDLARAVHRDQTWVSRRLKGVIPMTTDDLDLVSHALGMTAIELIASIPFRPAAPQTPAAATSPSPARASGTNYGYASVTRPTHLRVVPDQPHEDAVTEMAAA